MFPNMNFGFNFNTGWYSSAANFALCNPTPYNMMNMQMNQCFEDMVARSNLYQVQQYDFNSMSLYPNLGLGNSYFLDPNYAAAQTNWALAQGGGFNVGLGNFTPNITPNCGNSQWPGMSIGTPGSQAGNQSETAEDRSYNRKYNTLLSLCKQLVNYDKLSDPQKDELNAAIRDSKGTPKEKFEKLKAAYDKIDSKIVKKFVANTEQMGPYKTNGSGKDSFKEALTRAGYEYSNSHADDGLKDLKTAIENLKDNANQQGASNILGHLGSVSSTYNILDVLSSWNTAHKGNEKTRNIIKFICANIPATDDQETAKNKTLKPFIDALTTEARKYTSELDETSKAKLEKAIKDVNDKASNPSNGLAEAYDRLYVLTREAATIVVQNTTNKTYGAIDPKVFNDDLFITETLKDLREEGVISSTQKNEIKISEENAQIVEANKKAVQSNNEGNDDGKGGIDDEVTAANLVEENTAVKKLNVQYEVNGKKYDVVQETKVTDNRDSKRLFIVTTEGLKELKNAKVENGKLVPTSENVNIEVSTDVTDAKSVKTDYARKIAAAKEAEEAKKAEEAKAKAEAETAKAKKEEAKKEQKANKEIEDAGANVWKLLCEWTNGSNDFTISTALEKINKDNVFYFLKGVYEKDGGLINGKGINSTEGLIEKLDDDTSSSIVTMNQKKNIIQSVLDKANELGLSNDSDYVELKKIYEQYCSETQKGNAKTFNASFGSWYEFTNDNEVIDKRIRELYKKMEKQIK